MPSRLRGLVLDRDDFRTPKQSVVVEAFNVATGVVSGEDTSDINGEVTITGLADATYVLRRKSGDSDVVIVPVTETEVADDLHGQRATVQPHSFADLAARTHGKDDHQSPVLQAGANEDVGPFYIDVSQIAVPANPVTGARRIFVDSADGVLKVRTSGGVTTSLEQGGGGGADHNILSATHLDTLAAAVVRGDLALGNLTPKWARLSVGAEKASTTPSSIQTAWASKSGTARQVLVRNTAGDLLWTYLNAIDVQDPPRIKSFSDSLASIFEIDDGGTRAPSFLLTYEGTPSACSISMAAQMETDLEINAADYPFALSGDFGQTAEAGPIINNAITAAMINRTYTWTATATVDGTSGLTATTSLRWLNRRYHGPNTKSTDLTSAEILALDATADGGSVLDADYRGTWTVVADTNEYIWFAFRSVLTPDPTFTIGGIEGGFTKQGTVSHTNDSGFVETFQMWRSDNHSLGSTTVTVT